MERFVFRELRLVAAAPPALWLLCALAAFLCSGCGGSGSNSGTTATPTRLYSVAQIPTPSSIVDSVFLSPSGSVAGAYRPGATGTDFFLFLWRDNQFIIAGLPSELSGHVDLTVTGVNDSGQVAVGTISDAGVRAYRWQNGVFNGIEGGTGALTHVAGGISADGTVFGTYQNTETRVPFRWKDGAFTDLPVAAGVVLSSEKVFASPGGLAVGTTRVSTTEKPRFSFWNGSGSLVTDLAVTSLDTNDLILRGVSDSGVLLVADPTLSHPLLVNPSGQVEALTPINDAESITPGGTVLGYNNETQTQVLISGTSSTTLDRELPANGLHNITYLTVNDAGQLVALASNESGHQGLYLLTPTP